MLPESIATANRRVQNIYRKARQKGGSESFAEMLALQSPPMVKTDATWMAGRHGDQFDTNPVSRAIGKSHRAKAKAAGVSTIGKHYYEGLADSPGDIKAWVSEKGDFRRVVEERGWECEGEVNVEAPTRELDQTIKPFIADDIVESEMSRCMAEEGSTPQDYSKDEMATLKDTVRHNIGPPEDGL